MNEKKEVYVQPVLVTHELLRDITSKASGGNYGGLAFGRLFGFSHRHR
jgi:hypothetical protein